MLRKPRIFKLGKLYRVRIPTNVPGIWATFNDFLKNEKFFSEEEKEFMHDALNFCRERNEKLIDWKLTKFVGPVFLKDGSVQHVR